MQLKGEHLNYKNDQIIFFYNNNNYLIKMLNDNNFIFHSILANYIKFAIKHDPFILKPLKNNQRDKT